MSATSPSATGPCDTVRSSLLDRCTVYVAQMIIPLAVGGVTYVIFAVFYFILIVTIGIMCLRKGHWIMFIIGIFFPLFWVIGAVMPPARRDEIN